MYRNIWALEGAFHKIDKNIGVDRWRVAVELKSLLEDARFWIDSEVFSPDEIAVWFKHRIVIVRP